MEINRRDLLGAGLALGLGVASKGALGQEGGAARPQQRPAAPPEGGGGGNRLEPPVNKSVQPSTVDLNYKPRRLNKVIELWEDGQPMYYGGSGLGPGVDPYAQGVRMARTYMDAINVEMEHGAIDFPQLREFMRGLVDGGPTRSGHRTPAVFVSTCIIGLDKDYQKANSWVIQQLLDCGIHGIHMCHARDTEGVEYAIQMSMRYPFPRKNVPELKYRGLRGSSAGFAAQVWGVNGNKYNHVADLWPLNKDGELFFGVKIEDTFCDETYEKTIALPGIGMAEWGPGDHSFWYYGLDIMPEDGSRMGDIAARPEMAGIRQKVLDTCKKNKVMFLNAGNPDPKNSAYVIKQIQDGAMVLEGGEQVAIMGREYSKRKMHV